MESDLFFLVTKGQSRLFESLPSCENEAHAWSIAGFWRLHTASLACQLPKATSLQKAKEPEKALQFGQAMMWWLWPSMSVTQPHPIESCLSYHVHKPPKHWLYIMLWWLVLCQLNWATRCLDVWSNIILGVSVRVFHNEINFRISRLNIMQIAFPNMVGPIQSAEGLNRTKGSTLWQVREDSSCLTALIFLLILDSDGIIASFWVSITSLGVCNIPTVDLWAYEPP